MRDRGTLKPETERVLRERSAKLATLKDNPNFLELVAEFGRREERDVRHVARDLLAGKAIEDAQRDIDFKRGFAAALRWVALIPKQAEDTLERTLEALREAESQEAGEDA